MTATDAQKLAMYQDAIRCIDNLIHERDREWCAQLGAGGVRAAAEGWLHGKISIIADVSCEDCGEYRPAKEKWLCPICAAKPIALGHRVTDAFHHFYKAGVAKKRAERVVKMRQEILDVVKRYENSEGE